VEAAALDAVLAAILPSTSGPGAIEAGAGAYVRRRLAGPDRAWSEPLRQWLPAPEDADGAVAALAVAPDGPDAALFEQLRVWAWSGYLCDPALGGNVAGVGWARFDWSPPAGRVAASEPAS
jgi:Gluconate 2-dehydrogenase subunit 3